MREVKIGSEQLREQLPKTAEECETLCADGCGGCVWNPFVGAGEPCQYCLMLHDIKHCKNMFVPGTIEECYELGCTKCAIHPHLHAGEGCTYSRMLSTVIPPGEKQ